MGSMVAKKKGVYMCILCVRISLRRIGALAPWGLRQPVSIQSCELRRVRARYLAREIRTENVNERE